MRVISVKADIAPNVLSLLPNSNFFLPAQFSQYFARLFQLFPGMGEVTFQQVIRMIDYKHHVMEWYIPTPAGEMFKMMELSYTRVE